MSIIKENRKSRSSTPQKQKVNLQQNCAICLTVHTINTLAVMLNQEDRGVLINVFVED